MAADDSYTRFNNAINVFLGNLTKSYPNLVEKCTAFTNHFEQAIKMNPLVLFVVATSFAKSYATLTKGKDITTDDIKNAILRNDPAIKNMFGIEKEFPFHLIWAQSDAENKRVILDCLKVLNRRAEAVVAAIPADTNLTEVQEMIQNIGVINLTAVSVNTEESVKNLGLPAAEEKAAKIVMNDIVNSVRGGSYDIMGAVAAITQRLNTGEVTGDNLYTIIGSLMNKIGSEQGQEGDDEEEDEEEDLDLD